VVVGERWAVVVDGVGEVAEEEVFEE